MNLLIEYVTRYYAGKEFREPEWHGYLYAVTMLICISGVSLLNAQAYAQVCEAHPFHKVHSIPKKKSLISELHSGLQHQDGDHQHRLQESPETLQVGEDFYSETKILLKDNCYPLYFPFRSTSKRGSSVGEVVNLMAVDIQRFMDLMPFLNMIW